MGTRYLIDTNVVIDYFDETMPEDGLDFMEKIIDSGNYFLSVINRIELLSSTRNPIAMIEHEKFVESSVVIDLSEDIILRTIEIRQSMKIKLPDAVIAATAIILDLSLVTRNVKDFEKVPDLPVVNPHAIY